MSKYINVANSILIFILTMGATAAWVFFQEDAYQDRLARYSYVATLLLVMVTLDSTDKDVKPFDADAVCDWFSENSSCKSPTTKDRQPTSLMLYDGIKNKWAGGSSGLTFVALDLPLANSEFFRKLVFNWFEESDHARIRRAVYVRLPSNKWGWPALLVKLDNSPHWTIVQASWSNLWFLKTKLGRELKVPPVDELTKILQNKDWPKATPSEVKLDLLRFRVPLGFPAGLALLPLANVPSGFLPSRSTTGAALPPRPRSSVTPISLRAHVSSLSRNAINVMENGRCSPPDRSTCARSTAGKRLRQSRSLSH